MSNPNAVLDHLDNALTELEQAREEAGLGTSMMLLSAIEEVEDVKRRYASINDDS